MASTREHVSCGLDYTYCPDIGPALENGSRMGYDFSCMPIFNPRYEREMISGLAKDRTGPQTRSDMVINSQDWNSLVVAKISPWIDVDSENIHTRTNSEMALQQELNFASHLSVPAILLSLKSTNCVNLARMLYQHILAGHNHQFWLKVPTYSYADQCDDVFDKEKGEGDEESQQSKEDDTWTWWNTFRMLCDTQKKLSVALELTADLPSMEDMKRWCGEPLKAIIVPTSIFLTNRAGFPVLSKAHQALILRLYKLDVQVIISGKGHQPQCGMHTYLQYMDQLWQRQAPLDQIERYAKGYEDFLQCPLQPLKDNLESQTYEVFEKDPVKYSQYQLAVYKALLDRVPNEDKDKVVSVIMVLGAGRGPLVTASLQAALKADRKVKVYAVEKNTNAVVTLENLKYEMWGDNVTVVTSDMRVWEAPELADIIVSELLGSFGDNELSPECLDGADKFLKEGGISIPKSYTSFLAPLSSSKLWNEARICKDPAKPPESPFETPYVVRLHNVNILKESQPLFTFDHPNLEKRDNNRYKQLDFKIEQEAIMHGFAGYFDCLLYGDVTISINPQTHSPGMFSWFPWFIPVKEPMHLRPGDTLSVQMWRLCTQRNVWYEWSVTSPYPRNIHNPRGRSYTIDL